MSDSPSAKPAVGYKWKEISDLPEDLDSLRDRELESLCEVWAREKERIGGDKRVKDFNAELAREWAIETGIVEGVYPYNVILLRFEKWLEPCIVEGIAHWRRTLV